MTQSKRAWVADFVDPTNAVLVRYGEGQSDYEILMGAARPKDVKQGDRGQLVFRKMGPYALWTFVKD